MAVNCVETGALLSVNVSLTTTLDDDENYRSIMQAIKHVKERVWLVVAYFFIACLASILVGMMFGYCSTILLELDHMYKNDPTHGIKDQSRDAILFGGLGLVGAPFGGLIAWPLSDRFGRKPALMLGGIPTLIGWLMITYAHFAVTRSGFLATILLGRIFTGIGAGWFICCVSVHVAETSSAKLRGRFGACNQLFVVTGIIISYGLGAVCVNRETFQYYHIALIASGVVALFEFLMLFTMETPHWLLAHGRNVEANRVLNILRGPSADISKEMQDIRTKIEKTEGISLTEPTWAIRQRSVYIPFILVLMMMFYQQFGGNNVAIIYSGLILQQTGSSHAARDASIVVGVVLIIASFTSVLLIDHLGRKVLLVVASIGMCISNLLLGVDFYILNDVCHGCFGINCTNGSNGTTNDFPPCDFTSTGWLAIVSLSILMGTFSLAWGPIPWLAMSELMPLRVRGVTVGIATLVSSIFAAVVVFPFPCYADAVTPKFAWWSSAFVMFTSIFFVIFFLPESKGRSLEEIEDYFEQRGHVFAWTFRGTNIRIHRGE